MINKQGLYRIIHDLERGVPIMPGEVDLLREAVDLLDEMADTLDKIVATERKITELERYKEQYERESTGALRIIRPGERRQ